jgi:DNA-directed RNA polymerase specialized sigma24 family protein
VSDAPDDALIAGIADADRSRAEQSTEALLARYEDALLLALLDVVHDPLIALDMCAETMASALHALSRLAKRPAAVGPWLFELAEAVLGGAVEREHVPAAARHELGVGRVGVNDLDLARVNELADPNAAERARLPDDLVCAAERLRRQAPPRSVLGRIRVSGHLVIETAGVRRDDP